MSTKTDSSTVSSPRSGVQVDRVGVGLVGTGTVGRSVARILDREESLLLSRCKTQFEVVRASYRSDPPDPECGVSREQLTRDIMSVVKDPRVDVVVELIGGVEDAYRVVREALERGKNVVTANKALLADRGPELFKIAQSSGAALYFEGAIAGAVPVVSSIQKSFVSERFRSAYCILNGTTNYILSEMEEGNSYGEALEHAKEKGLAEADPSLDIDGTDAAEKLSLLVSLLFDVPIPQNIHARGIEQIEKRDHRYAKDLGYTIKLLGVAERRDGELEFAVRPFLIPTDHELAGVRGKQNALYLKGEQIGPCLLTGPGAGGSSTGAIVVSDIVRASRNEASTKQNSRLTISGDPDVCPPGEHRSRFYVRFGVVDRAGILSSISGILAEHDISISGAWAKDNRDGIVSLVMTTHKTPFREIEDAVSVVDERPGLTTGDSLFLPIRELK